MFELGEVSRFKLDDVVVNLSAALEVSDVSVSGPVRIGIDRLKHAAIAPFWPEALAKENAKKWIVDRLSAGVFSNVYAQGDLSILKSQDGWSSDISNLMAGYDFEKMKVDYRSPLRAVTNAKGRGVFDVDKELLEIDIASAKLMDIAITDADLEFKKILTKGAGLADIKIKLNGPVKSVLTYVKDEPIGVDAKLDVANAKGRADLAVNIAFPTKKGLRFNEVKIDISGEMDDVRLPKIVRDLALEGGPYAVSVKENMLKINGKGTLEGQTIDVEYQEFLRTKGQEYSARAKASLTVDDALRAKFGMDLSDFMDGAAFVNVVYTDYGTRAEAEVKADLKDARLYIKPFDYEKPVGEAGAAQLRVVLDDGVLREIVGITANAPDFILGSTDLKFRGKGADTELASGKASGFVLGQSKAALDFSIAPDKVTTLSLKGTFLDARPFLNDGEDGQVNDGSALATPDGQPVAKPAYDAPPLKLSVDVAAMRTADKEVVKAAKIGIDIDGAGRINALDMNAFAGRGEISVRYKSGVSGPQAFVLKAADAGAALRAFGLYDDMKGGQLSIIGAPINGVFDRNLKGSASITDFKVSDAPALTRLLAAMSLPGVLNSLNGDGLRFAKMQSDFDWLYKPEGSLLVLRDGRTSGNTIGLTFDGTFDNAAEKLDVKGTIIPMSGINGVIGGIPLVGDILTGGTGSLIAATYSVKGESGDPKVSVNPLSVLTPGILRRILFEGE